MQPVQSAIFNTEVKTWLKVKAVQQQSLTSSTSQDKDVAKLASVVQQRWWRMLFQSS